MKAFTMSYLSCCPLVWMCHSRTLNNSAIAVLATELYKIYHGFAHEIMNLSDGQF